MKTLRLPIVLTTVLSFSTSVYATSTEDLNSETKTPTDLVNTLLGTGITISNVTYTGDKSAAGTFKDTGIEKFEKGIILSSGKIADVVGPNNNKKTTTSFRKPGDEDLNKLVPSSSTFDAAVLEFDFVPVGNIVTFKYVFMSEEYNEFSNKNFNDVFGFFVNGVNIALLPDAVTPVSINSVNGGNPLGTNPKNPDLFINNDCDNGGCPLNIEPDGLTTVLATMVKVNANEKNHIKLAISDTGDNTLDSWILIKEGSFMVDNIKPSAKITKIGFNDDDKKYVEGTIHDNQSGLFNIEVTKIQDVTITGHRVGTDFPQGTTEPVIVTVTRIEKNKKGEIELRITDLAGNVNEWK